MKIYLVGGAVRDQLLGLPIHDRDYMVVGSTPEHMLKLGYQQVGKDFPVFLHPKTHEEYALARTERKSSHGYHGFTVYAHPDVTLEQDLQRRDLTINAMAMDEHGELHDPFHGQDDLNNKVLRHVSDAFIEDPLRVLRVARFAARFHHLGFTIAPETFSLMTNLADSGELSYLVAERIWQEMSATLHKDSPHVFIEVLHQSHALAVIAPELDQLFQTPSTNKDDNTGQQTLRALQQTSSITDDPHILFATLCLNIPHIKPTKNDTHTQSPLINLCFRLKVPNEYRELAVLACENQHFLQDIPNLTAEDILSFFNQIDVWRKPERLEKVIIACSFSNNQRQQASNYYQKDIKHLKSHMEIAQSVDIKDIINQGFKNKDIKTELEKRRLQKIKQLKQ